MSYIADFDPTGFDPGDPLTWPVPAPYSPGSWWYITAPGAIGGVPVDVGDRVYPTGVGRRYGELDYGDVVYGGDAPAPPWPADPLRVTWLPFSQSAPAWDRPPPPYSGCELVAGYRIVIEVLYNSDLDTRTYGMGNYGDEVYGSANGLGDEWHDITPKSYGVVARHGGDSGAPTVEVDSALFDLFDLDASLFPLDPAPASPDGIHRAPTRSSPIRVAILDPDGNASPIFSGRIAEVVDVHERGVRTLTVDAYGFASDLATSLVSTARNEEPASSRIDHFLARADWSWGKLAYPGVGETLRRLEAVEQVTAITLVDTAAISSSWSSATDRYGRLDVREWPLLPIGPPVEVSDRIGTAALASPSIEYVVDDAELLNIVTVASDSVQGSPELFEKVRDSSSVGRFGRSTSSLGFPLSGLSSDRQALETLAGNVLARHSRTVTRCSSVEADSALDPRWVPILAELERGRLIRTIRTKPSPVTIDHVLVGIEHRLTRGRWVATLFLSTLTPSL